MANASKLPSSSPAPMPIYLAGPTAVGKSALALALAETIGGEIISVDSMQVYRGLDIGTAKPTEEERGRVRHHLVDICALTEAFDAARFVRLARKAVEEIQARKRTPIFCGGTGLYFKAVLEGVGEAPPADPALRAALKAVPLEQLLAELQFRDPATFERIDRQNPRRVIRAVEVIRLTGRKFSEQRSSWTAKPDARRAPEPPAWQPTEHSDPVSAGSTNGGDRPRFFCLARTPRDLQARIDARVDAMFSRGLVEETRRLLDEGLAANQNAMQAIGYRQVVEHLRGERDLKETVELVKTRTRNFAKRQLTWFRRQGDCRWVDLRSDEPVAETLAKIL